MAHVDPDIAITKMTTIWLGLGLEVSTPLLQTWERMCLAFNDAGSHSAGWTAVAMPTGIGKTLFTALYCSLIEDPCIRLENFRTARMHPGVLFATRFIDEGVKFAALVNRLAGRNIATAYNKDSTTKLSEVINFPVVVITHAGCEQHQNAAAEAENDDRTWDQLITWKQGTRSKIIIDETPSFATPVELETKDLTQTLGALSRLRDANRGLYTSIEQLVDAVTDPSNGNRNRYITSSEFENIMSIDTDLIFQHLQSVDTNDIALTSGLELFSLRNTCKTTIEAIARLQGIGWGWVSFKGKTAQINSALLHPSLRVGSGVILDATAGLHASYGLLSPPARIVQAAPNSRNYDNVTLHLAWGHNAGKEHLVKQATRIWPEYRSSILSVVPDNDRVLVCCHKDFQHKVGHDLANPDKMTFEHWGNIDGKNDWAEYEAVALIGLFYIPAAAHLNVAQALLGPQTDHWLQHPDARKSESGHDLISDMQRGHLAATAIQAISRVRCRKVTDSSGRCKRTNVLLPLPSSADGRAVLASIIDAMPGIQIKEWDVHAGKRKPRADKSCAKLGEYFAFNAAGPHTKAQVRLQTKIGSASLDRAIKRIRLQDSNEQKLMAQLGVTYHSRYGRGVQSFFMKA